MKHSFLYLLLLGLTTTAFSQSKKAKVWGKITDSNNQPLIAATVILKNLPDSTVIKMAFTDTLGIYTIDGLNQGLYFLHVTEISHQPATSTQIDLLNIDDASVNLSLKIATTALNEVKVTATKPILERTLDKTIVNIENSIISVGGSALEVLERSPGIMVDKEGNISLRGKAGVTIYVDGRPSYMTGADLANLLRNIPSSQLSQIEIMTNPSAKYEAAGNGVINIITRKNTTRGLNGNLSLGYLQGRYGGTNNSLGLNYRNQKINIFSTIGVRTLRSFEDFYINRKIRNEATNEIISIYDQNAYIKNFNQGYNGKLGMDFQLSKKTTFGGIITGFYNPNKATTTSQTDFKKPDNSTIGTLNAPATAKGVWRNLSTNLNFSHDFNDKNNIAFNFDVINYSSDKTQEFRNTYSTINNSENPVIASFKNNLPRSIRVMSFKTDYTLNLSDASKLETGFKWSDVKTDNNGENFALVENAWVKNDLASNHFVFDENINSAYINYNQSFEKFELQLGLRTEQTKNTGNQLTTGQLFNRNYWQLFPTAFVSYTLNDNHKIESNFGRRIERPSYKDLNPFRYYLDAYTYEEGNPLLRPQTSNNVELIHVFKDGLLTSTLTYSLTKNIIQEVMYLNTLKNQAFERPENLNTRKTIGLSFDTEIPWSSSFSTTANVELASNKYSGLINNKPFELSANTISGNISNKIKLPKGWGIELSGLYSPKSISGTFIQNPYSVMNLGLQKSILNKKGSLKLSITDLFYSTKYEGTSRYQNVDMYIFNKWQSKTARLVFTYKFAKGLKIEQKQQSDSVQQELDRIKD